VYAEAQLLKSLDHDALVRFKGFYEDTKKFYIVMELVRPFLCPRVPLWSLGWKVSNSLPWIFILTFSTQQLLTAGT
jgi:serine/threonine protein kinase